jgi:N-acetylmuramoyl-L-alanine amidase
VYYLDSQAKSHTRLALPSGSMMSNAQLTLAKAGTGVAQRFYLERQSDGTYTIEAPSSQLMLSAPLSGKVLQQKPSVLKTQRWRLAYHPKGIAIVNVARDKALSFTSSKPGARAVMGSVTSARSAFTLTKGTYAQTGTFVLRQEDSKTLCVQVKKASSANGANVSLSSYLGNGFQRWTIAAAGKGAYTIRNEGSGKYLAVSKATAAHGVNIVQKAYAKGSKAQRWKLAYAGRGAYRIQSVQGAYVMDAKTNSSGANVLLRSSDKAKYATWVLGSADIVKIALDPGHGSNDSGAVGNGLRECDLTWDITQACAAKLRSWGYDVYVTVSEAEFKNPYITTPGLADRVARAVAHGCTDLFSMHINAGGGTGAVVLVPNSSSFHHEFYAKGQRFVALLLPRIRTATGIGTWGDGTWERNFSVADGASEPLFYPGGGYMDYYGIVRYARLAGVFGVIIEHGFIDSGDASHMRSAAARKSLGEADASAIRELL